MYRSSNPYHSTAPTTPAIPTSSASSNLQRVEEPSTTWLDNFGEERDAERPCKVIISNLPLEDDILDDQVSEMFVQTLGTDIISARTLYDHDRRFLGSAIVTLSSYHDARRACAEFDNQLLDSTYRIKCSLLLSPADSPPNYIANFLFPNYRYEVAEKVAMAQSAVKPAPVTRATTKSTVSLPHPPPPPQPPTGPRPRTNEPHQAGSNRTRKTTPPQKTTQSQTNPQAPSTNLISRIGIDLKDRIGGKAPIGYITSVTGQEEGRGRGKVVAVKGMRGNTPKEQAALLKLQRANKTRAGTKQGIIGGSSRVSSSTLAARISTKSKKVTAAQVKASNLTTTKSKSKTLSATATPSSSKPAPNVSSKTTPKTQEQLDDELKAYQRARRFGGADKDGDASMA